MTAYNVANSIADGFGKYVHPSAKKDELNALRQRSFIASRITGGATALCVLPVYLSLYGAPSLGEALAFALLISPIAIGVYLSRTGHFARAHLLSALNLAGIVTFMTAVTGGLSSFLLPWLLAVPMEASLSGSRRVIISGLAIGLLVLLLLFSAEQAALLPAALAINASPSLLMLIGAASTIGYATALAMTVQRVHKESETLIQANESRYRLLAENSSDLITRCNADGQALFVSLASERIVGCVPEDLLGEGLYDRVHFADRPAYRSAIKDASELSAETTVEYRLRVGNAEDRGTPQYRWIEMRCRPASGEVIAASRDISERKRHEVQLVKARDEARRADHAKSLFLANMSHELRTPLNAIIGFSELLSDETETQPIDRTTRNSYARIVNDSGQHLLQVVSDILDMSRIECGRFEIHPAKFDPSPMLLSCCDMIRPQAHDKNITLICDIADAFPEIVADERACRQMIINLLSNAVKFSSRDQTIVVAARVKDDVAAFSVIDNGIGISKDNLARLGQPFTQADNSYQREHEGAGLGLSVVKGLAELHGGGLEIASELGAGTAATILIPMHAVESKPDSETPASNVIDLHALRAQAGRA